MSDCDCRVDIVLSPYARREDAKNRWFAESHLNLKDSTRDGA